MTSFENTKSSITGSALGKALSMTSSTSWNDVVTKIKGVSNQGAKTSSLNCGGSYTIPAGYHNGSGNIIANSLSSQTSATAVAGNILKDKTAWVNGTKITGSIVNRGALNWSGSNTTYSVPAGYYSGGTLNSKTSYNNGYNSGYSAGRSIKNKKLTLQSSSGTYCFKKYWSNSTVNVYKNYVEYNWSETHQIHSAWVYDTSYREWMILCANGRIFHSNNDFQAALDLTHSTWNTGGYFPFPVSYANTNYYVEIWYT
nr:MAG TPA: hypothetical protein [Caudoviricetes sp.]